MVTEAVRKELERLNADGSALGAAALVLAGRLDEPRTSAHAIAGIQKELRETLETLRRLAPPVEKKDRVDEIGERRQKRLARRPTAKGL